jgi:Ni,Fe-hydrogenase I large subunit
MGQLAGDLAIKPGFWTAPQIDGAVPDTGPWSRRNGPDGTASPALTAWDRLVARVVDLLQLASPGGAAWLCTGAQSPAPGEGIAWTEMARGLLVHWVRLDASGQTVTACRVLAPTEWNFHPRGVLARALAGLSERPADERPVAAQRLAVAFDPCVAFSIADAPAEGAPDA